MRRLFPSVFACVFAWLIACCLVSPSAAQVAVMDLASILQKAAYRRVEYVEAFKNITAVETKTTEIFDKNGKPDKQRKVVSDFFVYQLVNDAGIVNEYRITREVDGKTLRKGDKQAAKLFENLAKTKNSKQEFERLREENLKYSLGYYRWGITLQPASALRSDMQPAYVFELAGQEKRNGRNVWIVAYKSKRGSASTSNLLKHFTYPVIGERGRIWLDSEDFQIWRWEGEETVTDMDIASPVVYMRDEIDYEASAFGVLVPKTIVTSFFDKKESAKESVRLAGRITYSYTGFTRFSVSTESEIQVPRN